MVKTTIVVGDALHIKWYLNGVMRYIWMRCVMICVTIPSYRGVMIKNSNSLLVSLSCQLEWKRHSTKSLKVERKKFLFYQNVAAYLNCNHHTQQTMLSEETHEYYVTCNTWEIFQKLKRIYLRKIVKNFPFLLNLILMFDLLNCGVVTFESQAKNV